MRDDSSSEEERMEEEEVKRLEKRKLAKLQERDFGVEEEGSKKGGSLTSKEQQEAVARLEEELERLEEAELDLEREGVQVERIEKREVQLSSQEKEEVLRKESPLLLKLAEEFKEAISQIKETLRPILLKVHSGELPTSKGTSFLELKYHLLLNYSIHLSFFLLLKAQGGRVEDHPVVEKLVELRTSLEKLQPIEKRLQYKIEKMLKLARGKLDPNDPSSLRPNLTDFTDAPEGLEEEEEGEREDVSNMSNRSKEGVYVPPKIAPMRFEEGEGRKEKEERERKKRAEKAKESSLFQFVRDTFGEAPEEVSYSAVLRDKKTSKQLEEIEKYEQENFVRLNLPKKLQKKAAKQVFVDELKALDEFGDVMDFVGEKKSENKAVSDYIQKIAQRTQKRDPVTEKDLDMNEDLFEGEGMAEMEGMEEMEDFVDNFGEEKKSEKKKGKKRKREKKEGGEEGEDKAEKNGSKKKKSEKKKGEKGKEGEKKKGEGEKKKKGEGEKKKGEGETQKRKISSVISKNKGIAVSKEKPIGRVKHKNKFEKALKRRKGQVKKMREPQQRYTGESSGIKKTAKHSISLRGN